MAGDPWPAIAGVRSARDTATRHTGDSMASFRVELDAPNSIVLVMVTEDDGSEHDYQFDFDPRSGRYEFSERDLLERDFGEEWVEEMEATIRTTIRKAIAT
jgi:hypothetical protein